jgi:hypothetical protein
VAAVSSGLGLTTLGIIKKNNNNTIYLLHRECDLLLWYM